MLITERNELVRQMCAICIKLNLEGFGLAQRCGKKKKICPLISNNLLKSIIQISIECNKIEPAPILCPKGKLRINGIWHQLDLNNNNYNSNHFSMTAIYLGKANVFKCHTLFTNCGLQKKTVAQVLLPMTRQTMQKFTCNSNMNMPLYETVNRTVSQASCMKLHFGMTPSHKRNHIYKYIFQYKEI